MGVTTLIHLILALPVVVLCSPHQWLHQIYVDNKTGVGNASCWEGGYSTPCISFNLALTGAQHYNHSTAIFLQPGQYQLHNKSQLRNMSQLVIVGNGSQGEVVIRCDPLAGLAFLWSQEINMTNVSLVNCGAVQNSSSEYNSSPLKIQVAIIFTSCKDIRLTHVHVIESNGTGVVIYNPEGVVYIDRCEVSSNKMSDEQETKYGGGGLMIETNKATSQSVCTIANSTFSHNTASSGHLPYWPAINPSEYFGLGRGGGISVVFRGGAANNTVQFSSVYLDSNRAQFGGGCYLAFLSNTSSNIVSIDGAEVTGNKALPKAGSLLATTSSGGGVFIGFEHVSSIFPFDNLITVSSSNFISNTAEIGGGMTVDVLSNSDGCTIAGNKLVIEKCVFDDNEAFQGASAYMSQSSKSSQTLRILDTTLCCSNFTNGHCSFTLTHGLPCSGSVLLEYFTLTFSDYVMFADNNVSALGLYSSSSVELLPSTQLYFTNNQGINGAALSMVDCSSLVVSNGVNMVFKNNVAYRHGGAIYAESCNLGKFGSGDCVIRHNNSALHPEKWNINVTFISNHASGQLNSIYMNSIRFCTWLYSQKHKFAFCWNGWHYLDDSQHYLDDSCQKYLRTGPASIESKLPKNYTLYPGDCFNVNDDFNVYDDYSNDITDGMNLEVDILFGAVYINDSECTCRLTQHSCAQLDCFVPCAKHHILLLPNFDNINKNGSQILIHPPQLPGIPWFINFESCKNGTVFNSSRGCICEPSAYNAVCARHSLSACTTCFDVGVTFIEDCSFFSNGNGMCGSCNDTGFGVAINSPHFICVECQRYGAAVFVSQLILVLIMMIILAVLHINITNGNLNAYILFSQIMTTQFPTLGYSAWVPHESATIFNSIFTPIITVTLSVYSIWNLNFLTLFPDYFCIPHIDTAAGVIGIQYIIAVCPLLFIVVTYTWIRWYNNGYRFVVWITRPVHQLLARFWQRFKIQPSLIDTYAGLLLISFMCFLATSVKLSYFIIIDLKSALNTNHSINVTVAEHAVLGVTAILCLLVFVVPLMVLLLFYHLKIFQRCLTWCKLDRPGLHALVDAYQGCFKNSATDGKERRYFAGLYLLFRFCYLAFVVLPFTLLTPMPLLQVYTSTFFDTISVSLLPLSVSEACLSFLMAGLVVILQPYKKTAHNVIDFLLLFYMAVIGASSFTLISFGVNFYVLFILVIVIFIYLIYHLLKCCCCCKRQSRAIFARQYSPNGVDNRYLVPERRPLINPTTTEVVLDDNYVPNDLYPDRMVNPGGYREQHCKYQPLEDSVLQEN